MTEVEWLACDDPAELIAALEGRSSDRKFRLFAVAGCYRSRPLARKPKEKFEVVVRFADGLADLNAVRKYWGRMRPGGTWPERPFVWARTLATEGEADETDFPPAAELVPLVRDIFGNPFRPTEFSADWRTDTAVTLAKQMYEANDFSAMPILADALQDAGCTNEDVLQHCRGAGPHARGCWVVDLLLGKA